MNMSRLGHNHALLLGLALAAFALVGVDMLFHAREIDRNVVGTWVLPINGGRWLWKIDANGTYSFHSEAADGAAPHAGMLTAKNGVWTLRATNGYNDGGTYRFEPPDTLYVTDRMGTSVWHRLADIADDSNTFGTWVLSVNNGRWVWKINPDHTYEFHSEAGDGIAPQMGTVSASGGYWWLEARNGYGDGGTYKFEPPDTLAMTGRLGAGNWLRDSAWCQQTAQSAADGSAVALQSLTTAAQQGDDIAQDLLAAYFHATKDDTRAVAWWRKSAAQGNVDAETDLGWAHWSGNKTANGVPRNDVRAVEWFRKAATQGGVRAEYDLALAYMLGRGVPKDHARAAAWMRKAAAQGDLNAKMTLLLNPKLNP